MSQDSFTEVTREGWGSRLGKSFKNVIGGLFLFIAAFPLLFWNEGRAVQTYKSLKEGQGKVVSVDHESVDPAHEGKLVHVKGKAMTQDMLRDSELNVSVQAIKLDRKVEMYQWEEKVKSETKKKLGGGTETVKTYDYVRTWSDKLINSSNFKKKTGHYNPGSKKFASKEWKARNVSLGAYKLSPSLIDKISNYEDLSVDKKNLPPQLSGIVKVENGSYYYGNDSASPQIGDLRIKYQVVYPSDITVVAQQVGSSFSPFATEAGDDLELLQTGLLSSGQVFKKAHEANTAMTWILRIVGFFMMFIGLAMVFKPLSVMGDVVPFIGSIIGAGTSLVAFLISAICSLVTIAIAWLFYRPFMGIVLLALAGGLVYFLKKKSDEKKLAQTQAQAGGSVNG